MENYDEGLFKLGGAEGHVGKPIDDGSNYYHEYCRLYLANVVLTSQMKGLIAEKAELQARLARLEEREEEGSETTEKGKRHRRTASEISRHYKCSVESCQKSYGSEGSLNQHIRLKHPDLFATLSHIHGQDARPPEADSESQDHRQKSRPLRLR